MIYALVGLGLVIAIVFAIAWSAWKDYNDPHH